MKTYKKSQNCCYLLVKKCNKEIWQERMNVQDLEEQKIHGAVLEGAVAVCEVVNNLINLKNSKDILGKELRLQLSNAIKICTDNFTFLEMANLGGTTLEGNTYLKFYHQSWSLLPTMSLHHQNFC